MVLVESKSADVASVPELYDRLIVPNLEQVLLAQVILLA